MEHRSPALQADSFPAEPPGKPKLTQRKRREAELPASHWTHAAREGRRHAWAWIAVHGVGLALSGVTPASVGRHSPAEVCSAASHLSTFFYCCFGPVDTSSVRACQEAEAPSILMQGLLTHFRGKLPLSWASGLPYLGFQGLLGPLALCEKSAGYIHSNIENNRHHPSNFLKAKCLHPQQQFNFFAVNSLQRLGIV